MSRREDRSSDRNRRRSRFDSEPSPKRYRRDGKLETERLPTETEVNKDRHHDQKHHRRLQDPVPLEDGSKFEIRGMNKESEKKINEPGEGIKHSSDPTKIRRSRSYFQHDDRGSVGQNGRSFRRRTDKERGWWRDSREQQHGGAEDKTVASDARQKDEKAKDNKEDNRVWRHDGYFEMEANPNPPLRKRPSFREQKISTDPEKHDKVAAHAVMPNHKEPAESGRRDERWHSSERFDRPERSYARKRELNGRDRYDGSSSRYGGRERFTARQGYRPTGGGVEKWKHDLYNEANRSPTPKNEEDQISKIEALLTS